MRRFFAVLFVTMLAGQVWAIDLNGVTQTAQTLQVPKKFKKIGLIEGYELYYVLKGKNCSYYENIGTTWNPTLICSVNGKNLSAPKTKFIEEQGGAILCNAFEKNDSVYMHLAVYNPSKPIKENIVGLPGKTLSKMQLGSNGFDCSIDFSKDGAIYVICKNRRTHWSSVDFNHYLVVIDKELQHQNTYFIRNGSGRQDYTILNNGDVVMMYFSVCSTVNGWAQLCGNDATSSLTVWYYDCRQGKMFIPEVINCSNTTELNYALSESYSSTRKVLDDCWARVLGIYQESASKFNITVDAGSEMHREDKKRVSWKDENGKTQYRDEIVKSDYARRSKTVKCDVEINWQHCKTRDGELRTK